jgi:hypothetical protein
MQRTCALVREVTLIDLQISELAFQKSTLQSKCEILCNSLNRQATLKVGNYVIIAFPTYFGTETS